MSDPTTMPDEEWVGRRVRVTALDVRDERGVVEGLDEVVEDDGTPTPGFPSIPRIRLDSGRTIHGCECWWTFDDNVSA